MLKKISLQIFCLRIFARSFKDLLSTLKRSKDKVIFKDTNILLSPYQDFLADYGMVWVGDDDADSDYDVLEETPSSFPSSLSRQQQVWNPGKTDSLHYHTPSVYKKT